MKIRDLIKKLKTFPEETNVVFQDPLGYFREFDNFSLEEFEPDGDSFRSEEGNFYHDEGKVLIIKEEI